MRTPALLAVFIFSFPVAAATLRGAATLDRPQVRIADLFDDAGAAGPRVLGPGPMPGGRIVVEAAQLAAIARQFGVAWRPSSAGERIVIDRPGKPVPREDVVAALRNALMGQGAAADADLELPGFATPLVALAATPQVSVEQLDYDSASGRFTAILDIGGDTTDRMRVSGRVQEMAMLPVPTRRLLAGSVIAAGDLQMQRVRAGLARGEVVRTLEPAMGMVLRRAVAIGQPLALADITRALAVQKGDRVRMQLQSPGLSLSALGEALEGGALGERITVLNPTSRAQVIAQITAPGQVRVEPDAIPIIPNRTGATVLSQR